MAELVLEKVTLRNWVRFRSAVVKFPEYGLVMVTGQNTASGGKLQSVGAGKTSLGEAVGRALLGVTGRFTHVKECSTGEKGDTYVCVEASYLGKPLKIEMGYKCPELSPSGEALRFHYDGQTTERQLIQQTRADLCRLIGIDSLLAAWTIFIDGDYLKFDRMSQADRVDLVMAALRQPPWNAYYEKSKAAVLNLKRVLSKEQGALEQTRTQINAAKENVYTAQATLNAAKRKLAEDREKAGKAVERLQNEINSSRYVIETCTARKDAIAKEVEDLIDARAVAAKELEIRLVEVRDRIRELEAAKTKAQAVVYTVKERLTLARSAYSVLAEVPEVCPTCQKPWDQRVDPDHLHTRKDELDAAEATHDKALKDMDKISARLREARETEEDTRDQIENLGVRFDVNKLSSENTGIDRTINRTLQAIHDLEVRMTTAGQVSEDAVRAATAVADERMRALDEVETNLTVAAENVAASEAALKVLDYWNKAYSPAGIPNMILRDSVGPLNHEAQRVSSLMTGGTIGVRFSTARAKAGGDLKPELLIDVDNELGGRKLIHNSKGENGLTNFIIAETLSTVGQIGHRVGFRWFDEVVPHQDPVVCRSIYAYLRDQAHRQRILIFIVDHNPVVANYADHFLRVTKSQDGENCFSEAEWET